MHFKHSVAKMGLVKGRSLLKYPNCLWSITNLQNLVNQLVSVDEAQLLLVYSVI